MQSQVMDEVPVCPEGHGMMVPVDAQFCYAPAGDGLVTAIVSWHKPDGIMTAKCYAPHVDEARELLEVRVGLGELIAELMADGRLFQRRLLDREMFRGYRIDDFREGHMWTYLISLDRRSDGPRLLPKTIYLFWPDEDEHEFPPLDDFDEVVALMGLSEAVLVSDVGGYAGRPLVDAMQNWEINGRIVVWDLGAIQRTIDGEAQAGELA